VLSSHIPDSLSSGSFVVFDVSVSHLSVSWNIGFERYGRSMFVDVVGIDVSDFGGRFWFKGLVRRSKKLSIGICPLYPVMISGTRR